MNGMKNSNEIERKAMRAIHECWNHEGLFRGFKILDEGNHVWMTFVFPFNKAMNQFLAELSNEGIGEVCHLYGLHGVRVMV